MTKRPTRRDLRLTSGAGMEGGPVLITGGAGFIGTNLAHRLLGTGTQVIVFDNLSRSGVEQNLKWLRETHGANLRVELGDVRDAPALARAVRNARNVVHLAAQVAVTTSLVDPLHDFEVNARGTLNLLNALDALTDPPPLLFTSTNKVYGALQDVALTSDGRRYRPTDAHVHAHGIDETRPLEFCSPYGCSKGAADQYVLDYARTMGVRAVVFRMSCIYGPHQVGTEDQGWVAHFLMRALRNEPITLYGDGQQVRDILFVDDLIDAMELAFTNIDAVTAQAFNMGGGADNTASLIELIDLVAELTGFPPAIHFDEWRPGDQRYYVSDTAHFAALTGWRQRVRVGDGIRHLHAWLVDSGNAGRVLARAPAAWSDSRPAASAAAAGKL